MRTEVTRDVVSRLFEVVGSDGLVTSHAGRAMYRKDAGFINAEPLVVCLPSSEAELQEVVRVCGENRVPISPRGSGTGLAGGAIGFQDAVVLSLARMNRILELNEKGAYAWVEPGLENARLDAAARKVGLRYAPDPSSQVACSIGGNVGTNAGGPHCLAHGVTSWHVLAVDLIDLAGCTHRFGSTAPEQNGLDIRGVIVGSEGTFGIVSRIAVKLMPVPECVRTLLLPFDSTHRAAEAVSAIIARGCIPVAMELMDQASVRLVEQYVQAGYPTDSGAVLLVEFEGPQNEVQAGEGTAMEVARRLGSEPRRAESDSERAGLWKGRKAIAGAIAVESPDYYLHDVVVPRTRLAEVLDSVLAIAERHRVRVVNVAHAGDGNLHPLILFDRRDPDETARVFEAGDEMVRAALEAGGVLSGEHGIGLEKRRLLHLSDVMSSEELDIHLRLRRAMDPTGLANPGKKVVAREELTEADTVFPEGTWL